MNGSRRFKWKALAAMVAALVVVLIVFYSKTQAFGESGYWENVTLLGRFRQLDALWDLNVLKSKGGADVHYDILTKAQAELSQLLEQLASDIRAQSHDDPGALAGDLKALGEALQEKSSSIEQFKSCNSLLRNSLVFLPTAAQEIDFSGASRSVSGSVNDVLLATMLYSQHANDDRLARVQTALDRLESQRHRLGSDSRERLDVFETHVNIILREQQRVDELVRDIATLPTAGHVDSINQLISTERRLASAQNDRDRQYLLAFSALLIGVVVFAAIRLVRDRALIKESRDKLLGYGQGLERMVADRVAALRESESRLTQLAQYDALTGLPNRNLFRERLAQAMARANRDDRLMALMFVDLDHFKQINDSLGHVVGDKVLMAVAKRLRDSLRDTDAIARLGGDEFTVIAEGLSDASDAETVATKIKESLVEPLAIDGREFVVSASVGIALYSKGTNDGDMLLQAADIAMYKAKERGRNVHAMFAPEMATEISERANMAALLRGALDRQEFELVYQPKLELATGRIAGVEALLRWHSGELGPVSPVRFVPLAEELGLIGPIGEWVLRTACAQGQAWREMGLPPLTMAVNLSPCQLRDADLLTMIADALRDTRFPAAFLELELTEGVIMENVNGNSETLTAIRSLGASLAVDDFGTGYSSLAYLARLPIQTLKIDRAFVTAMHDDENAMTLVSTIVTLAHSLRLNVVAEGVETLEQQQVLQRLGCDQTQGYYFSRPIAAGALEALLARNMLADPATTRAERECATIA